MDAVLVREESSEASSRSLAIEAWTSGELSVGRDCPAEAMLLMASLRPDEEDSLVPDIVQLVLGYLEPKHGWLWGDP